jgi:hypothetical protein
MEGWRQAPKSPRNMKTPAGASLPARASFKFLPPPANTSTRTIDSNPGNSVSFICSVRAWLLAVNNIGTKSNVLCESDSDSSYSNPDFSFYRKPESVAVCATITLRAKTSRLLSSEPNILLFDGRYPHWQLWSFGKVLEKSDDPGPATRIIPAGQTLAIRTIKQMGKRCILL